MKGYNTELQNDLMLNYEMPTNNSHFFSYKEALISTAFNIVALMIIKYFWEQYLNYRQIRRNLIKQVPPQLTRYNITQIQFILSQSYSFDKLSFEMLALSIKCAVDCLCIITNVPSFIWNHVDTIFPFIDMNVQYERAIGYVIIQAFKSKTIDVPFQIYQTFLIQKRHKLTTKTLQLFVYDLLVEATLMLIIFPPIIVGYLRIIEFGGQYFYIFLQVFILLVTLVLTWIHPNLIAPLFNQFNELDDPILSVKIHQLADSTGFPLGNIFRMNGSVRSAHSNAYFYGFGRTKMIVLYDTLIDKLNTKEVTSVVSHEIGHWAKNHSFKKLFVYIAQGLTIFYIFSFFITNEEVFRSFGFREKSTFIGTALFFSLFEPLTSIFQTILLVLTRRFQFEADQYACKCGFAEELKESLVKLFRQSASTVTPDPLFAWFRDSHPNIHERIAFINKLSKTRLNKFK